MPEIEIFIAFFGLEYLGNLISNFGIYDEAILTTDLVLTCQKPNI